MCPGLDPAGLTFLFLERFFGWVVSVTSVGVVKRFKRFFRFIITLPHGFCVIVAVVMKMFLYEIVKNGYAGSCMRFVCKVAVVALFFLFREIVA